MATQLSKSQLVERIATSTEMSKRDVKNVMESLVDVGHKELKKNGIFLVPGFAKFVVVKNPMNYRLGYAGVFKEAYILDTPGPTPAVLHHV